MMYPFSIGFSTSSFLWTFSISKLTSCLCCSGKIQKFFSSFQADGVGGGYVTDEELELKQTIQDSAAEGGEGRNGQAGRAKANKDKRPKNSNLALTSPEQAELQSPSKEVLIADNSSRR